MRTSASIIFASLLATASLPGIALTQPSAPNPALLAQNTGAVDRSQGNGSMGTGDGIVPIPANKREAPAQGTEQTRDQRYDESGHGDNDTDMEHRPRRTLGDDRDD